MPGEKIVLSGNFLIDSESRMKAAVAGVRGESSKDPVCGMDVDETKARAAGKTSQHGGVAYFFCSEACKKEFDANPAKHAAPRRTADRDMVEKVIDFSVKNKLVVFILVAAAAIWGAWSLKRVPLDAIPDLCDTQVIVYSRWDRSPDIVEDQVTYPIVTALLGAPKVKAVRGFSDFGYSYVYVDLRGRHRHLLGAVADAGVPLRRPAAAARRSEDRARARCHRPRLDLPVRRSSTPRASTAWRSCAPTRTGTCATT